jgi:hypothetical protein
MWFYHGKCIPKEICNCPVRLWSLSPLECTLAWICLNCERHHNHWLAKLSWDISLQVEINKSPSDLQCTDLYCVIVTGEAFLKLYLLAKCFTTVYVSKEGLEGGLPGSAYRRSFVLVAIELSISPRYNINLSLLLSQHPNNTKIIKFSFVMYAYFNFGNIYMDNSFKL